MYLSLIQLERSHPMQYPAKEMIRKRKSVRFFDADPGLAAPENVHYIISCEKTK